MRVGIIAKIIEDRKFGFIQTDHFRDDVFFHQSSLQGLTFKRLYEGQEVEFEINEILRMDEQKLEATIVQAASRPLSKSIDEDPQRGMRASHHPRARQRKPTWRNVSTSATPESSEAAPLSESTSEDSSGADSQ